VSCRRGSWAGVSAASKPSYDELAALVMTLRDENTQLKARIAELEARQNQNSRNSSKPPGSDSPFVKSCEVPELANAI